jgi:diguanylate cyclase (GGDEF)-like protein
MPLRVKLFLGIVSFFSIALSFFGYIAYDSAVQASTAREIALLQDLAGGLSRDLRSDIGDAPDKAAIQAWLGEFGSLHMAILVAAGNRVWLSDTARNDLPRSVIQQITASAKSGNIAVGNQVFVWDTIPLATTPYTLTVIHRTSTHEARIFFKHLAIPLFIAALIILWVAFWSTQYIASLLEKLHAQKNKLQHQAMHDALTNLPNRSLMLDRLQVAMREVDQSGSELALLFIDLNRFKEINDTLGHHYGDMLLVEISRRLASVLRKSDMIARLGGDEFAVVISHVTEEVTRSIADKLIAVIGDVIEIEGNKLFVTGSMGIARYPTHASDTNTLVQYADVAMYAAKRAGVGYVVYDAKLDAYSRDKLTLTNDLRDAVTRGQMSVHYQAKTDMRTGCVVGAEALLRWQHNTFGHVPPERFITLAEQTGSIRMLTEFVLDTAMRDLQRLLAEGYDISFAINLSAVSMQDPELPSMLLNGVEQRQVPPARVVLEITETAVMDQTIRTTEVLNQLATLGFRISMDDFGTGHSSLVNLRLLPLQEIKIDRSFVMNMLQNEDDATIVRTIIELAHSLGKRVVAEGVETLVIQKALASLNCDIAQGYHISRPIPFAAFASWLADNINPAPPTDFCLESQ